MRMFGLIKSTPEPQPLAEHLEDILQYLARFGLPRVFAHFDGTWSCSIEVSITPVDAKFVVRSDYKQRTPIAAALQCRDRLREAIASLEVKS